MNYDRIILELLDRVKSLEEQVEEIKHTREIDEFLEENEDTNEGLTRFHAREKVMKEIEERFPDYAVFKASRADGSGILLHTDKRLEPHRIKFYHSKLHARGHAWHSIKLDEISRVSYVILSMLDNNNKLQVFIYTSEELLLYEEEHRKMHEDMLHLYLTVNGNQAIEIREEYKDVSEYLNNWEVLSPENLVD